MNSPLTTGILANLSSMSSTQSSKPTELIKECNVLNLVIPPDMDPRKEWFPRHYEPSILLTRDQVESFKLPTDPAPVGEAEAAGAPTIVVGRYIGHDIAYDLHYASLRVGGVDAPGLVVRMIDFAHHTTSDVPIIEKTIATELGHWAALERLQGSAIPRLGGVFVHGTLVCQVFEDAGVPIPPEERLQQRVRDDIAATFQQLCDAGVAAHTVTWRPIRRGSDGLIKIASLTGTSKADLQAKPVPRWGDTLEEQFAICCEGTSRRLRTLFAPYKRREDERAV